jgi:hypothetical protein
MNPKITTSALKTIQGKHPDELVSLTLRTTTPLTTEEMSLLTSWGGKLLYDNGIMAIVHIPVSKVNDIASWGCVLEAR